MAFPENIQKLPVGYSGRVVVYLESLGMIAKAVVGGIFLCAARVSNARANNSIDSPEPGIRSPESPHAKGGGFVSLFGGARVEGQRLGGHAAVFQQERLALVSSGRIHPVNSP